MFSEADQLVFQTKNWSAIPRISRTVPFGYRVDDDDPDLLQPVVLELEALEKAKVHLLQFSTREVAQWLTETTGREISHEGLRKRLNNESNRRRKEKALRKWAKRIEEVRAKADKILKTRTGAGEDLYPNE